MGSPNVLEFNDGNFNDQVLKSPLPVPVYSSAGWSGPCRQLAPIIGEIADDYQGKVKVGNLDIDISDATMSQYNVRRVPSCLVFKDGQVVGTKSGSRLSRRDMTEFVDGCLYGCL